MTMKQDKGATKQRKDLFAGASMIAALAATMAPGVAHAQDTEEEIVVTGSRIARPGFTSNSPIATVGAEEIQRQQPVNIEEVLRNQPQFNAGNGSQVNNGSSGAATLDLRGLSEPRTLPLVDGRRMPGFDPDGLFDVSVVPLALLERVDVVTGGASAVYGSDAMAGVVNFILNDDFQGVDVRGTHSWNDLHDTGDSDSAEITVGSSFDDGRGNAALSLGWLNREAVFQIDGPAALAPGASSYSVPAAFDNAVVGPCDVARTQFDSSGNLGTTGGICPTPYQTFDFNGQNLYQSPQERWNATALAHYEINPNVEAYARFMFNSSTSAPQLASSAVFGDVLEIPLANPFLTAQASNYLATHNAVTPCSDPNPAFATGCVNVGTRWRAVDVGPRQYRFEYDTFQSLVGFRGELGNSGWEYDVAGAHGETSLKRQQNNDINLERIQQALFATDATTCTDPSDGCVPLNILNPALGSPDPAALQFISLNLQVQSLLTQDYVTGAITGDLGDMTSPFATSPIGLSFGAEYRKESIDYRPDAPSQGGLSPGFGTTLPVAGEYDVMEFFTEALVPLVGDAPFAQSINLELGFRTSDYSISGRVEAYKYGLDWAPIDGLRFRGMFQRAVRAPNLNELFQPRQGGTGDALFDPCSGVTAVSDATLFALCQATGAPDPENLEQPTVGQVNNFIGGSTSLVPETADTFTLGVVFQPDALPGFRATVDYFRIEVTDAISVRPAFDILDGCYNPARNPTADATLADCLAVIRGPTGLLEGGDDVGVEQLTRNIGEVNVEGIDYSFGYEWDIGAWGVISASLDGTHLLETNYVPSPTSGSVDCVGYYGKTCGLPTTVASHTGVGGPVFEDKWAQRTTWTFGDFELSYRWRHLSEVNIDPRTADNLGIIIGDPDLEAASSHIDAFDYFDLAGSWQAMEALRLTVSVTNVTDEDAPFVFTGTGSTAFNSGNTYPSSYDVLGRVFTIGMQARF